MIFEPLFHRADVSENIPREQKVRSYMAQDLDKMQAKKVSSAVWLAIRTSNGIIVANGALDRESLFVKNDT